MVSQSQYDLRLCANRTIGALCGSEFVNQNFITWLKVEAGNFKSKCRQLGLTPTACIKQASATFENIKVSFTEPTDESEFVPIRGAQHSMLKVWDVELTRYVTILRSINTTNNP